MLVGTLAKFNILNAVLPATKRHTEDLAWGI